MFARTPPSVPLHAALALALLLPAASACERGGDGDASSEKEAPGGGRAALEAAALPKDPLEFPVAAFEAQGELPVSADLRTFAGKSSKLKSLLAQRSLVVYIDTDQEDRNNKAASRWLRALVEQGQGVAFRVVIVFPQGTESDGLDSWRRKRGIPEGPVLAVDSEGAFASGSGWQPRSAALVDGDGKIAFRFEPSTRFDDRLGFEPGFSADLLFAAFAPPDEGPKLDVATKQAAVDLVRTHVRMLSRKVKNGNTDEAIAAAPGLATKLSQPAWVSLFRPGSIARLRGRGDAGRLADSVLRAADAALDSAGESRADWLAAADTLRFSIELPGEPVALPTRRMKTLWNFIEPGVDGLVVRRSGSEGVLLPAEPVTLGFLSPRVRGRSKSIEKCMQHACKLGGLGVDDWKKDDSEVLRFRSQSFGVTSADGPATDFYRGITLWPGPVTEQAVLDSIRDGGRWLARTVREDGKFDYEYFPNSDEGSKDYNFVRHAGAVYGLFEMYTLSKQEPALQADTSLYIEAAARSMGWVYDSLGKPDGDTVGDRICLNEKRRCESGSAALSLMTFLVRPEKSEVPKSYHDRIYRANDEELIEGLALTLVDMIDSKGRVWRTYSEAKGEAQVRKEPLYYPGESMLALIRLHQKSGDLRWLDAAKRIADNQIRIYEKDRFETPDHWVMQAFYRLWQSTKDEKYPKSAYAMANHYVSEQHPFTWSPFPDYVGAYRREDEQPRTTRAQSRSEALRAVVELAWEKGDSATDWEESLVLAARHMIENQWHERNAYWMANLQKAHGAYRMGVADNHCRIDNNQHGLVGLVGTLEVLRRRGEAASPAGAAPAPASGTGTR
jgi:hypothetical protein